MNERADQGQQDVRGSAAEQRAVLADVPFASLVKQWKATLDEAVHDEAARQVADFCRKQAKASLEQLSPERADRKARETPARHHDAIVAFAQFFRYYVQVLRQQRHGSKTGGTAAPEGKARLLGVQTPQVSAGEPDVSFAQRAAASWTRKVPKLAAAKYAALLKMLSTLPQEEADRLQSFLHVYFTQDWGAAADIMLELAFQASRVVHECTRNLGRQGRERLLGLACGLINDNEQFAQHYECRQLSSQVGYDSRVCEPPEGQRSSSGDVEPQSFYVVRKTGQQTVRKARVRWG